MSQRHVGAKKTPAGFLCYVPSARKAQAEPSRSERAARGSGQELGRRPGLRAQRGPELSAVAAVHMERDGDGELHLCDPQFQECSRKWAESYWFW